MDIQQLKLLAERVRVLLQKYNHTVGYNQSLDLIAALPGLRNWPEVQAFPDRVVDCALDGASVRFLLIADRSETTRGANKAGQHAGAP